MLEVCSEGHALIEGNVRYQASNRSRICLTCARVRQRAERASAKAAREGLTKPRLPRFTARVVDNFWSRVEKTEGCWLWCGALNESGYGRILVKHFPFHWKLTTHRVAWILTHGPIPDELVIDHLCRVKACVNPDHMELVTREENSRRALYARFGMPYPWDENLNYVGELKWQQQR